MKRFRRRLFVLILSSAAVFSSDLRGDNSFVYAVQIAATVQSSPARIHLRWEPDPYGARSYTVFRKSKSATSWGTGTVLPGNATGYTDPNVAVGGAYEYQVIKAGQGYTGYGYINAGIAARLKDARGKLILIVDNRYSAALAPELAQLKSDLIGDGWQVIRRDVSRADSPANVKNLIVAQYN